jgi:hypothetical protein
MKNELNKLFFNYSSKVEQAIDLRAELEKVEGEMALLKESILNEPKLHEVLTTVGVIHGKEIYKKVLRGDFCLEVNDYIEPVHSFQLEATLGGEDE